MAEQRLLVVGAGKRVREAALPVFEAAHGIQVAGVVSRTPRTLHAAGRDYPVEGLDALTAARLSEIDLVYMVVAKPAVPAVLRRVAELDASRVGLLIETPVMLFRHYGHLGLTDAFREAWVTEDTYPLPCFTPIHELAREGTLGALEAVRFEESAYAYHGIAMAKGALGATRVLRAQQARRADGRRDRTLQLEGGGTAHIIDPRDYSRGRLRFDFARGSVADHDAEGAALRLEAVMEDGSLVGFRAGDHLRALDDIERSLVGAPGEGEGLTAWMDGMKRVGLLALVRDVVAGRGAYPLSSAVEDAVVDYHLERLHRYWATPLTDPRSRLARLGFKVLTRVAGR